MMSTCFTWLPIASFGDPNIYKNLGDFTRMRDFTWRVSDWWCHLRKHIGINAINYFMYDDGPQRDPASFPHS